MAKFVKDSIYRTKVILRKPVWTSAARRSPPAARCPPPAIPNHIIRPSRVGRIKTRSPDSLYVMTIGLITRPSHMLYVIKIGLTTGPPHPLYVIIIIGLTTRPPPPLYVILIFLTTRSAHPFYIKIISFNNETTLLALCNSNM